MAQDSGTTIGNRYTIKDQQERGRSGIIYRAYDQKLKRDVALKEYTAWSTGSLGQIDSTKGQFERGVQVASDLDNPYIIPIYDYFIENNAYYVVMPFMPYSLENRLDEVTVSEGLEIILQICEGLQYAHRLQRPGGQTGILHCSLKPSNILFDVTLQSLKISDFSMADAPLSNNNELARFLTNGGSIYYLAPEQLFSDRPSSTRTDVYSVGALMYRLLTGRHHFDFDISGSVQAGLTNRDLLMSAEPDVEPLSNLPSSLSDIILKALSRNVAHRYADAGALLDALKTYHASQHEQVRKLYFEEFQVDDSSFDKKKAAAEWLVAMHDGLPADNYIRNVALSAVTDLAELVLGSPEQPENIWQAIQLLYPLSNNKSK